MMRSTSVRAPVLALAIAAAAGCVDSDKGDGDSIEAPAPDAVESAASGPEPGLTLVTDVDVISGIWVPVETHGAPVDDTPLGAYWSIDVVGLSVDIVGHDGCNPFNLARPSRLLDDGGLDDVTVISRMAGCPARDTIDAFPMTGSRFFVDAASGELIVDPTSPSNSAARFRHVAEPPLDLRGWPSTEEAEAERSAQEAIERAERESPERADGETRERIELELPEARQRWADSDTTDYTLRFEVGALRVDPSFPEPPPAGAVWEIDVVGGVALENDWAGSALGDTVADWFSYIESQLDSHYLRVEFDVDLGYPTLIDSQPLDAEAVADPNEIVAWLIRSEVGPLRTDRDPDAPRPGFVRLDDLDPLETGFWDPVEVDGGPAAFLDSVYWTISHDAATGLVSIGGFDGCNAWGIVSVEDPNTTPRLIDGALVDVGVAGDDADCANPRGLLTSYPADGSEFWFDAVNDLFVIAPTTGGVSLGFRRLDEIEVWTGDD